MKIAFVGTHSNGKTKLVEDFLQRWPMYKTSEFPYRDTIKDEKLKLNQKGDKKSQKKILDAMVDEIQSASSSSEEFLAFDGCIVENVAYSLWLNSQGLGKVDDDFINDSRVIVNQTVKQYDLIFYSVLREDIKLGRKVSDENLSYRKEIDYILDAMVSTYDKNKGIYFPTNDCPAVIRLEGPPDLRVEQLRLYLKNNGKCFGEEDGSLITTP